MPDYDVLVIGAGPGGYVAAIKAAQHGKKTALVEREQLGGICLNWGCIPTKALLKSAELLDSMRHARDFGIVAEAVRPDFAAVMRRSREVAQSMSKGIEFLMRKNKVEVLAGSASLAGRDSVLVTARDGAARRVTASHIIIATGHKPRSFPHLPVDGVKVLNYRHALALERQPASLLCIGAGAIGMEFGYFFHAMGTRVTIVEVMDQVLPNEDAEIARFVERQFAKSGIQVRTGTTVTRLEDIADGVRVHLEKGGQREQIEVERVLVAVGFLANTEGLNLDAVGVKLDERGFIAVDEHQRTSVPGIYAIGDVAGKQLLAHKASFEGEAAVGHICGRPAPVDYRQIPGCTYCQPQVASIGLTEKKARAEGRELKVGRFQFVASGKAKAIGHPEGMVKLIFDAEHEQLLGAHIVGVDATEMLGELCLALRLECTARELAETVHAHPTLAEAVMEAAADALGHCVHQ
ncbi:MAG: dihydrolipoyl dehydrogenase [Planctomycetota bacterium]|nr:dihydrolipoyl dehydrogenase [Planctomycetota bacterium]MCX8040175.1 dihydrolipoyl dehydrogenase [Planctomycetota bacterium]MDW8372530.1 dihydrolipoyl dehydrogenase [Planctomycetota bacterium]